MYLGGVQSIVLDTVPGPAVYKAPTSRRTLTALTRIPIGGKFSKGKLPRTARVRVFTLGRVCPVECKESTLACTECIRMVVSIECTFYN